MAVKYVIGIVDYIVIGLSLLLCLVIGIAAKYYGGQQSAREYLMAGKKMAKIPVMFSMIATMISPTTMLGSPAEVYKYGVRYILYTFLIPVGMYLASIVFIPVFFQCGVTTVNEFLEMRFGKIIRYIVSSLFVIQMLFSMAIILYGSVLALSSVSDLSMPTSIFCLGAICAVYCSVGGLKAVLWTDTLQACFMVTTLLAIYIVGIQDAGGISKMFHTAKEGHRFDNILDFRLDFFQRYNLWGVTTRCLLSGFAYYGTHQLEIQRILSLSDIKRAKSTVQLCTIPTLLMYAVSGFIGIVLYAIYSECDPVLNGKETGLVKYDQLVPAYIVTRFSEIPGLTGLCIVGIFSASLSSISSCLNCASTVTVVDFIKPVFEKKQISDSKIVWLAKIISLVYGGMCIGLSFLFLQTVSIKVLAATLLTFAEGPILAVFFVAVLCRKANDKCVSIAAGLGLIIMAWISFGSIISRYQDPILPMKTSGCSWFQNSTNHLNVTYLPCPSEKHCSLSSSTPLDSTGDVFVLYKISYMWFPLFGMTVTFIFMFIAVLITGWRENVIPADSKCLSPITRYWMKTDYKSNGLNTEMK